MNNSFKLLTFLGDRDRVELLIDIVVNSMVPDHTTTDNDRFINDIRHVLTNSPNVQEFMNDVDIDDHFIESFIINNEDEIKEKYKLRQHSWLYNQVLQLAINIKEPLPLHAFVRRSDITNVVNRDWMGKLTNDDLEDIYYRYSNNYELEKGHKPLHMPEIRNVNDRLREYVATHDDLLSLAEFARVVRWWSLPKNKTIEQLYVQYCSMYNNKPGNHVQYAVSESKGLIGYKGKQKRRWLGDITSNDTRNEPTNFFPLKSNIKRYQTHKVSSRGSYIIDLMFEKRRFCYLVAININTRFLVVTPMNIEIENHDGVIRMTKAKKNITSFLRALSTVESLVTIHHLYGDNEPAFVSHEARKHYGDNSIVWHDVPRMTVTDYDTITKSEPQHTSLGIIDRVIRTIRDIAWNMNEKAITPTIMKSIVEQYNNAPHNTLSHYAGFPVTPTMVLSDAVLEEYITREIMKENYNITRSSLLRIGDRVKVYNISDPMIKRRTMIVPGEHRVTKYKNGYYNVRDSKGHTQKVPRYRLSLMNH